MAGQMGGGYPPPTTTGIYPDAAHFGDPSERGRFETFDAPPYGATPGGNASIGANDPAFAAGAQLSGGVGGSFGAFGASSLGASSLGARSASYGDLAAGGGSIGGGAMGGGAQSAAATPSFKGSVGPEMNSKSRLMMMHQYPSSASGTPSTAYLDRAKSFAERIQATMTSAVANDSLYNALAGSPATETYATSRAHEIMEELVGRERDKALAASGYDDATAKHRTLRRTLRAILQRVR